MKVLIKSILKCIAAIRFIPVIILFYIFNEKKKLFEERDRWYDVIYPKRKKNILLFIDLLNLSEYRSVLYFRLGVWCSLIKWLAEGQKALFFDRSDIDVGLVIQHGHSTRINAKSIGKNCQIWQNVTIGTNKSHSGNLPVIGDNVKICTGSIVIGDIRIGNNVIIGAGTVVVKNVPDNSVVVGNPGRVIKYI